MPARRLLPIVFAGIAAVPIPACLHVSGAVTPQEQFPKASNSSDFASFPKRPGELVAKNPGTTASKPPTPETTEPKEPTPPPLTDPHLIRASEPVSIPPIAIPSATEPPLLATLRAYLENRPDDAIKLLQSLDRGNQDFALALLPVLVRGTQMNLANANPEEVAVLVDQLHAVAGRLEPKAALRVEKVAFCRRMSGFGRYEPWSEGQPYKPNDLAVLYVELRNIGSEPVAGPAGETYLCRAIVSLEVRDATGNLVEQTDPADWRRRVPVARFEHADHTRSPLHDYSRTYRISVPAQPGVYTVTVEVKDPSGRRVARSQPAEFRVAGP